MGTGPTRPQKKRESGGFLKPGDMGMVQAWQMHRQRAWCTRSLGWVEYKAFRNSYTYLFCWVWVGCHKAWG